MAQGATEHRPTMDMDFPRPILRILQSLMAAITHHTTVAQSLLQSPTTARIQTWNLSTREHYQDHRA